MPFTPSRAVGGLGAKHPTEPDAFLGSAFAFRSGRHWLTAAHCVGDLTAEQLALSLPGAERQQYFMVGKVEKHPTADLAIVTLVEEATEAQPFVDQPDAPEQPGLSAHFGAYGYPEDFMEFDGPRLPTSRAFVGFVQRVFEHESHLGYAYNAFELSIPAPEGLSGGPVFWFREPRIVFGIVVENVETYTVAHSEEYVEKDGAQVRIENRRVINYGVAVHLHPHVQWLDERAIPRNEALARIQREPSRNA